MNHNEEGLVFRRHRDWLEGLIGAGFTNKSNCSSAASLSINDAKLADVLISKYDYLDSCISNDDFGNCLNSNLVLVLKFILENGPYLDSDINFKEQIDMFFTMFRNLLRNNLKDLPDSISLLILRLIEIRACRWKIKPSIEEYYMSKIDRPSRNVEPPVQPTLQQQQQHQQLYCFSLDPQESVSSFVSSSSGLRASKSYGDIMTNYKNDDAMFGRHKQLKSNSKAIMKGEVVIKNSDSGKVMGIRGRRVAMIESLSDTIISFQKVGPTARDRIVQISGQTPANISVAKNLIDATIKQNASPIAFSEIGETGEFINSNHPPQSGDPYSAHDHATNKYNSAIQSSALNSLCEGGDPAGHSIKVKLQDKEACIIVSDKLLGEKLEQFLSKFNFVDFIKSSQSEEKMKSGVARSTHDPKPHNKYERNSFMRCNPAANVESVKPNLGANCEPVAPSVAPPSSSGPDKPKPHITYDRDFLLKFKTITHYTASRVIEDIKMKQGHLFRC